MSALWQAKWLIDIEHGRADRVAAQEELDDLRRTISERLAAALRTHAWKDRLRTLANNRGHGAYEAFLREHDIREADLIRAFPDLETPSEVRK